MMAGNQGALSLDLANGSRVKDLISGLEIGYPAIGELIQKKKSSFRSIKKSRMKIRRFRMAMKSPCCRPSQVDAQ